MKIKEKGVVPIAMYQHIMKGIKQLSKPPYTSEVFQDRKKEWRFRIKAGNGEIVLTSESYTQESNAVRALRRLKTKLFRIDSIQDAA